MTCGIIVGGWDHVKGGQVSINLSLSVKTSIVSLWGDVHKLGHTVRDEEASQICDKM